MKIWTVDAFTEQRFHGNPAAVTLVNKFPSDDVCHQIAQEMNLSETAFVKPLEESHFHIRWFTPTTEVKLCGHATMASAHILWEQGVTKNSTITFDSLSGLLRVLQSPAGITLDFPLQTTSHDLPLAPFQDVFGSHIIKATQAYDDVILEVSSEKALKELPIDIAKIRALDCRGIIVTTASPTEYDFVSRFFAPRVGVNEDPVTGSAHCKLADYWHKKTGKTKFHAYQASQRGGHMVVEIISNNRVHLTSQAVTVLSGELRI